MTNWRTLLLAYRELNVRLPCAGRQRRRFHHRASDDTITTAFESFRGFPELVRDLSGGAATADIRIEIITRPLVTLTGRALAEFWPSPDDTRPELDFFAPTGSYDSVFVFWPQHDFATGASVPGSAWGLGMGASDWTNGATYAAVANAPAAAWKNEARGEVWLHEWLHGVCHHFSQRGFAMPERDADGAELHGYTRSATVGWTDYYRDLMSGSVKEKGRTCGIPAAAWSEIAAGMRVASR